MITREESGNANIELKLRDHNNLNYYYNHNINWQYVLQSSSDGVNWTDHDINFDSGAPPAGPDPSWTVEGEGLAVVEQEFLDRGIWRVVIEATLSGEGASLYRLAAQPVVSE